MKKIFSYFGKLEWLLLILCAAVSAVEVYAELKMPEYITVITNLMTDFAPTSEVWINGVFMLLCAVGSAGGLLAVGFFASLLGARVARRLRSEIFDKVMDFSLEDVNRFSAATLITRSTNDVTQVQMLFSMGAHFIFRAPILAVWAIIKIVQSSWEWSAMTGGAVLALLIGAIVITLYAMPKFKQIQSMVDDINRILREQLSGVRVVRAYNAEQYSEDRFDKANTDLTDINMRVNRVLVLISPMMNMILCGVSVGVFIIGGFVIQAAAGEARALLFADMMSMTMYVTQVLSAFLMLVMIFMMMPRALVAAKRVAEVLDVVPGIADPENPADIPEAKGEIEFCDVSFRYPGGSDEVLRHISFKAERGQTVALIGATGSGKTTLINLVPRFYDVSSGCVRVDGVDVRDYRQKDLRGKIGYVPQRGLLFSGALGDNINYGAGAETRGEDDIRAALDIAQASGFVAEMEGELDASIAQGGTNVSGGQRQRLAIARAVCRRPEIYIFDDSFSALDFKTDRALRDALKESTADATKLIVAQRVGTIMDADRIVVLNDGEQVGVGTHKELMESCDIYREIALSQLTREELA